MKTYYVSTAAQPTKRTAIRARDPMRARSAYLRKLGHEVRISPKTGMPLCTEATMQVWQGLVIYVPTRTGKNPPLRPLE